VICDDPQTDATARSHIQTQERLDLLNGAVTGLAGPGKRTAIIIPCTVIRPGDMADTILDPETHPEWRGERTRMVTSWPRNEALWTEYRRMREDSMRSGGDGKAATEFYVAHRDEMDEGSVVSWPERFEVGKELSAIQHAMNIRFKIGDESFAAEYQNDPMESEECVADALTVDDILSRLNRYGRGVVPDEVTRLTAYADVQGELLYWMVCGWGEDFSGYVLDYGTFPDQRRLYFTLAAFCAALFAVSLRNIRRKWIT
jgi:hypothetical protein